MGRIAQRRWRPQHLAACSSCKLARLEAHRRSSLSSLMMRMGQALYGMERHFPMARRPRTSASASTDLRNILQVSTLDYRIVLNSTATKSHLRLMTTNMLLSIKKEASSRTRSKESEQFPRMLSRTLLARLSMASMRRVCEKSSS